MTLSTFDLYSVGIGPSSSHTVGPMRAAKRFVDELVSDGRLEHVARIKVELFGSLGATGRGHGSEKAVLLGLEGDEPDTVDTDTADSRREHIRDSGQLRLAGRHVINHHDAQDLLLHRHQSLPGHPNGMRFAAFDHSGAELSTRTYYSIGGGFVVDDKAVGEDRVVLDATPVRFPFANAAELLAICRREQLRISDVIRGNEASWRTHDEVDLQLSRIWHAMEACVRAGYRGEGVLPGGLHVPRRAPAIYRTLSARGTDDTDPMRAMDWVNLWALAVNEENAAGGRVVTAPTNGAAGIVPAVLHYYMQFISGADEDGVARFLLTAAAIGMLFKQNASISGAEVGCQGEVGSACAMAAGALCEVLGGTPEQVENAAEVGLEHNLGLTCDPIGGLVQIPCIERNAIAAVKAINAARLALHGDGQHKVSLDAAIKTMRDTGHDMHVKYKETSTGGLAVNFIEC